MPPTEDVSHPSPPVSQPLRLHVLGEVSPHPSLPSLWVPFLFLLQASSLEELRFLGRQGLHAVLEQINYGLSFVSLLAPSLLLFLQLRMLIASTLADSG